MRKYNLKIIQSIFCVAIMAMIAFGNFSVITICFLEILFVLFAVYDIIAKYSTQWKRKIENKQEFVKDIFFVLLFCIMMIVIVVYRSIF